MAALVEVKTPSLGEKLTACLKDAFKSCYNFNKKDKTDPGERKSAKLELEEVSTNEDGPVGSVEPGAEEAPMIEHNQYSNNVMTYGQMNTTYDGGDHESVHHSTRGGKKYTHYDFQSTDSFEFSDEETHYWKQAREVMKRNPSKSVLQRQGRGHRNSKLVRFGSVVRKFDKLDELLQESQEMDDEEYYDDEEGSVFDEPYEEEYPDEYQYGSYYDQENYQAADTEYGSHMRQGEYDQLYGYSEQYEQDYQDESHNDDYQQEAAVPPTTWETEEGGHVQNSHHYDYSSEQAPTIHTSLGHRGSFKGKTEHQMGGVVPSAFFHKPLAQDEYKVDIKARVKALESGRNSQQSIEIPKNSTTFVQDHLPYELSLPNYEAVKAAHAARIGKPLYTHPGGYKFRIDLWANGKGVGMNTHISVTVQSLEGEYNDNLRFPVRFTITLELMNQYSDYDHHVREIGCFYREESYNSEIGRDLKFISKNDIYWNAETRTQFLLNDVLRFRLTKITLQ